VVLTGTGVRQGRVWAATFNPSLSLHQVGQQRRDDHDDREDVLTVHGVVHPSH
jgi:hypothetical protein